MARLLSQDEVLTKLAALQSAEILGRQLAQDRAVEQMAKVAGVILAQAEELPEMEKVAAHMEKVAWQMVEQGQLNPEQFQFLKEAGIFSRIGKFLSKRAPKLDIAAGKVRSRLRGVAQKFRRKPRVAPSVPQQASRQSGPIVRKRGGAAVKTRQRGAVMSEKGDIQAVPASKGPVVENVPLRGNRGTGYRPPKAQETPTGYTSGAVPKESGRLAPSQAPARAPAGAEQVGDGPYRRSGKVQPPPEKAPAGQKPTSSTSKSRDMAQETAQQKSTQQGQPQEQQQGWWQRLTGGGQPGTASAKKGGGWGRLALYGGAGLGAYGLYKGVGWGARQLEQASTSPMAYGGGWSPVPYGYGHTPYGPGSPTMGGGA